MVGHRENETSGLQVSPGMGFPKPVLRFAFYAFIFSIPYEILAMGLEFNNFSISKMVGFVFMGLALMQARVCFKAPSSAIYYFSLYLYIYVLYAIYQGSEFDERAIIFVFRLIQWLVLLWISQNLMAHANIAKGVLLTLGLSTLSLALMTLLRFVSTDIAQGRISALGQDANAYAGVLSFGLLALVGLANSTRIVDKNIRWITLFSFSILAVAIVQSGSRGIMASLVVALLVLAMKDGVLRINLRAALLVFLVVGAVLVTAYQSDAVRERWERTLDVGDLSGRDGIMMESLEMIKEKPLMGWGPVAHYHELGSRFGMPILDPHNMYLWVMQEVGLLGAVPFFIGVWLILRGAWRARAGIHGQLPMAMILLLLLTNMSVTHFTNKLFWVVCAYAIASESAVRSSNLINRISRKRVLVST